MSKVRDISGQRFGSLVAVRRVGSDSNGHSQWECICDCGKTVVNLSNRLLTGNTSTCGCRNGHGMRNSRLYRTWVNMKARCYDPRQSNYRFYGAKGIRVCDEWKNDFRSFQRWAEASGYSNELTIDRIDSKKDYYPKNCQWLTVSENSRKARLKCA